MAGGTPSPARSSTRRTASSRVVESRASPSSGRSRGSRRAAIPSGRAWPARAPAPSLPPTWPSAIRSRMRRRRSPTRRISPSRTGAAEAPSPGGALNLIRDHGLCHGEAFRKWMAEQLGDKRFRDVENLDGTTRLKMVATDISRGKMLVLPEDLADYIDAATGPADRPPRLSDRRRRADEHVDPVLLLAGAPHRRRRRPAVPDRRWRRALELPGMALRRRPRAGRRPDPTFGFKITGGHGVGGGLDNVVDHLGWPVEMAAADVPDRDGRLGRAGSPRTPRSCAPARCPPATSARPISRACRS